MRSFVRVRPLLPSEEARGELCCCDVLSSTSLAFHPRARPVGGKDLPFSLGGGRRPADLTSEFEFHGCKGPSASQEDVFEAFGIGEAVSRAVLAGEDLTMMAYGQTGSGKTYTLIGREAEQNFDGLVSLTAKKVCGALGMDGAGGGGKTIECSFFEIYNEEIYDLLRSRDRWEKSEKLQIRAVNSGFWVAGLESVLCSSFEDVLLVQREGGANKRRGKHALNLDSSRSHCLLSMVLPSGSRITFVDLAGSERLKETVWPLEAGGGQGGEGTLHLIAEAKNINKSLFMLGKVIDQLSSDDPGSRHVQFRDSKLTKVLAESLGGGGSTCFMITCISPAESHLEVTLQSLNYAAKAMSIRQKPRPLMLPPKSKNPLESPCPSNPLSFEFGEAVGMQRLMDDYREQVAILKAENAKLKDLLSRSDSGQPEGEGDWNGPLGLPLPPLNGSLHKSSPGVKRRDLRLDSRPKSGGYFSLPLGPRAPSAPSSPLSGPKKGFLMLGLPKAGKRLESALEFGKINSYSSAPLPQPGWEEESTGKAKSERELGGGGPKGSPLARRIRMAEREDKMKEVTKREADRGASAIDEDLNSLLLNPGSLLPSRKRGTERSNVDLFVGRRWERRTSEEATWRALNLCAQFDETLWSFDDKEEEREEKEERETSYLLSPSPPRCPQAKTPTSGKIIEATSPRRVDSSSSPSCGRESVSPRFPKLFDRLADGGRDPWVWRERGGGEWEEAFEELQSPKQEQPGRG